jgi:hypothetical protein
MIRNLFTATILSLALAGVVNAQGAASSTETVDHYTQAQLKVLVRDAHAPEQYNTLAGYYSKQQKSYLQQATEVKKEWERTGLNVSGAFGKYPRPVDSARNLYEYYMAKASKAATLEAKYSNMAATNTFVAAK